MIILGIDPGTGTTGFGVIKSDGQIFEFIEAGVIKTKPNTPMPTRLMEIYDDLMGVIKTTKPELVSIEKLFFAQNVTTAMAVSQARGVIMLAAEKAKLPVIEYTPLQIKQALSGYGRAEKKQIQEMVRVMLKLKSAPKPDDCADALAAAICHAMSTQNSRS